MTSLSACLIVRNEEQNLQACLAALEPFVDEICVVDTGSADRTVRIAKGFGVTLGHFEWCDDFAAARNACLELATCEWILSVDADELLDPESTGALRDLLEDEQVQAYLVWLENLDGGTDANGEPSMHSVGIPRLFRRRAEIRWERPVHESVMNSLLALGAGNPGHSHLRLVHHGYLSDAIRRGAKHQRNLGILERRRSEEPHDLFNTYKLACTHLALGRPREACSFFESTWQEARGLALRSRAQLPFLPLVASELIRLLSAEGQHTRAWEIAEQGLADYPTVSEILYRAAELQRSVGRLERAGELYLEARACEPWTDLYAGEPGTRAHLPQFGLARVSALAGDLELAWSCTVWGLELSPRSAEGRALAARLLSVSGKEAEAWQALDDLLGDSATDPHVLLFAAEMAWARGERESARGFWSGAIEIPCASQAATAWLAIADLVAGDLDGAALRARELRAVDLPEAGALTVLAAVLGETLELDPLFERSAVLGEVRAWLGELARDPEGVALSAFARGAGELTRALPGVEALLAQD